MSKIEVNTVEPQCGSTLTLGACGQTVALGSGASQTGFGRTGTVDWITTPKVTGDSPITGVTGKGYFLNTTAGTITINLPAGSAGDIISMADYAATWQTNKVTVAANGSEKIGGDTNDATLETEGQSVTLVYVDSTQGWVNTMDSTSNVRGVPPFIVASGGDAEATCGDYKIHIFTGPGTFAVSSVAPGPSGNPNVASYLVVAGGGAGESYQGCNQGLGGGGGGGFRVYDGCSPATPPLNAPAGLTLSASPYPITVGGGGVAPATAPACSSPGASGNLSTFDSITSAGGGGTGGPGPSKNGLDGGSGGGGGRGNSATGAGGASSPVTSPAQGQAGGGGTPLPCHGPPAPTPARNGGGGGGAGAAGAGGFTPGSGAGGAGSYICGSGFVGPTSPTYGTPGPVAPGRYFSGGGGGSGGNPSVGAGGAGGGTTGVRSTSATNATDNIGGGGGAANNSPGGKAGNGGSGLVMIRYKYQ